MKIKIIFYALVINISLLSQQNINFELAGFDGTNPFIINNEPSVAVNPTDPNNIVIATNYRYLTGGTSPRYNEALLGIYYKNSPTGPWNFTSMPKMNNNINVDPSIAFETNGKLWCAYIGFNSNLLVGGTNDGKTGVYANYSEDGGATWLASSFIIEEPTPGELDVDKTHIYINQLTNQVFVAYSQEDFTVQYPTRKIIKIAAFNSTTGNFSEPFVLNDAGSISEVQAPFILTDQENNIYVFFYSKQDGGSYQIRSSKLTFDGSFHKVWEKVISNLKKIGSGSTDKFGQEPYEFRVINYPVGAIEPVNGEIYVLWSDDIVSDGSSNIMMSKSTNDGETWSSKIEIDQMETGEQFSPWIDISDNNRINIIYYHMDSDIASVINPVYLTSFDGGLSFQKTEFFNDDFLFHYTFTNWPNNNNFIGDYIGISSNDDEIIAAYTGNNLYYPNQHGIVIAQIPKKIGVFTQCALDEQVNEQIQIYIDDQTYPLDYSGEIIPIKPFTTTEYKIFSENYTGQSGANHKFRNWEFSPIEYSNSTSKLFDYTTLNPGVIASYKKTLPLTVTNNLEGGTGGVWEVEWEGKPVNIPPQSSGNPFYAFDFGETGDLYSITAPDFNALTTSWKFLDWGDGTTDNPKTGVPVSSPTSFTANYKGNLASTQTDALTGSSQRKIIRDGNGIYHAVYTSMDKLWYTKSLTTDFNGGWTPEEQINFTGDPFDEFIYTNPSIDNYGNTLAIVSEIYDSQESYVYLFEIDVNSGSKTVVTSIDIDFANKGNANPVVSYTNTHRIIIYKKSPFDGLKYIRKYYLSGSDWSDWLAEVAVPNTTAFSNNPSIAGYKTLGDFHLVWQEGNSSIKYVYIDKKTDNQVWFQSYNTISSGSSYSNNQFPSISLNSNYSHPIVSWRGGRKEKVAGKISNKLEGLVWVYRMISLPGTLASETTTWGNFYVAGSGVGFTNNNSTSSSSPETVIAWSENNGTASKWLRRQGTNYSAVEDLSHNGTQIQISNSSTLSKMKGLVLSEGNLPYILQRTTTAFQGLGKISGTNGPTFSRTGVVYKNGLEFVFNIGDILLNGENVLFVERADTLPVTGITELNEALNTNTFSLNSNSELLFSNYYYVVNPEFADSLLTEDDEVTFMVQLVNADNNQVVGTFDQVTYNRTNVGDYDNINYTVDCSGIENGNYYFRLVTSVEGNSLFFLSNVQNDADNLGKKKYTTINYDGDFGPKTYSLSQNYPNPFNPSTTIKYQIPANGNVMLKIYDILGREVTTLVDEYKTEGRYEVSFNASSLASGVYLYRLSVNDPSTSSGQNYVDVKKMILLK